jgi:hypothetical protein
VEHKNLDIYGAAPLPWSRVLGQLDQLEGEQARRYWLATVHPDGRPHMAGIGARWIDGVLYFTSGSGTRKSRNLSERPDCVVSVDLPDIDLVIEGRVDIVTDEAILHRVAAKYAATGWPAAVADGAIVAPFSAPSAGPPPWNLWMVRPVTAFCVATGEPQGATRWSFDA